MTNATNNPNDPFVTVSMLENRLTKLKDELKDEIVGAINQTLGNLIEHMDERFAEHDKKFDQILATLNVHSARIDRLELLVSHLYPEQRAQKQSL